MLKAPSMAILLILNACQLSPSMLQLSLWVLSLLQTQGFLNISIDNGTQKLKQQKIQQNIYILKPKFLLTVGEMAKTADVKVAVFGRAGVGKSALVVRFLTKRFIWEYDPTLESTYRHQATIDDEIVSMELLDTAGQEDAIQREGHVRWGEGFVIVYDITDRGSFEEVLPFKNLLDDIKKPKNVNLILVGNKADLDHSRQVSTEEGEKLATELACAFYECSACTGEGNITEAFHELCREVRRRKMIQGKTRRRSSTTHVKQAINKMLTKISS